MKYLTLINASSDYHNQKLDEKPSYLATFFMSISQVVIHKTTIERSPSGINVPEEN